jgi:flavin-dependent dehydrogenase
VWFDADLLPGYAWSFPLAPAADGTGRVNIGFGIPRGGRWRVQEMKGLWADLLDRPHVRAALGDGATLEGAHRAWPIPARIDRVPLTGDRVLYVGDAATATDPMTGEGIGQALLTGRLAAEAIGGGGFGAPERITHEYARAVRAALVADHRMSMRLQRILVHERGAAAAVRIAGLTPWTRANFARWLFEDEPRAVVCTPRRWHRHFLARPGAFAEA